MTNIEFLVNELRKANETIENLRKECVRLKRTNSVIADRNKSLMRELNSYKFKESPTLGDIDALAALREKLAQA